MLREREIAYPQPHPEPAAEDDAEDEPAAVDQASESEPDDGGDSPPARSVDSDDFAPARLWRPGGSGFGPSEAGEADPADDNASEDPRASDEPDESDASVDDAEASRDLPSSARPADAAAEGYRPWAQGGRPAGDIGSRRGEAPAPARPERETDEPHPRTAPRRSFRRFFGAGHEPGSSSGSEEDDQGLAEPSITEWLNTGELPTATETESATTRVDDRSGAIEAPAAAVEPEVDEPAVEEPVAGRRTPRRTRA